MSTEQQMKIQLAKETWYDWLAFVPRHQLGKIVPMIGDRKFGSIVQPFLHEYREIKIDRIQIVAPYKEDPSGHPRVQTWQNNRILRFKMAETQMPANIKNFDFITLNYLDQSVINFMQKFQQNGLLDNVTLAFDISSKNILHQAWRHILPLLNGILSVEFLNSAQLVNFYDPENSKEIYELNMKMMEETRFLGTRIYDSENLHADRIDLYCRWLYQTARADGKPRVLLIGRSNVDSAPISLFIDRLKQDFLMATDPVTFFIQINLLKAFQPLKTICLDNDKTKERLLAEMEEPDPNPNRDRRVLLISRYPLASKKNLIVNKEKVYQKTIYLSKELKVVGI